MNKENPFYSHTVLVKRTAFIKNLGEEGSEITFRSLTEAEDTAFNLRLLKGSTQENPHMNMEEASEIKYEKIAMCLIEPKVTVKDLRGLYDSGKLIAEILKAIEPKNDVVDAEGNLKS